MTLKLASLPMEVIDHVFSYISAIEDDSVAVTTILNLYLCKTLQHSADRALFLDPTRAYIGWNWKKASRLRDILKTKVKNEPHVADYVKKLSHLATYHNILCRNQGEDVAGKWFWEIVKSCENIKELESPSRLQGSPILAYETIASALNLERLDVRPLKSYTSSFIESHELVCSLRRKTLHSLHISTYGSHNSGIGHPSAPYRPTSERPTFDLHELSFRTNDFVEFIYPSFVPANLASLRSLHLEGLFSHTVYAERFHNLRRLADSASPTLKRLVIRALAPEDRITLEEYRLLRHSMSTSLQFDPHVFFGTSSFPNLRSIHLEGVAYLSTRGFQLIADHCEELEVVSFANSIWNYGEWWRNRRRISEETCISICTIMSSLLELVSIHLGDLPIFAHEPTFQIVTRYCEEHEIDLDYRPCIDEFDRSPSPDSASAFPTFPTSSTACSVASSDSRYSDPFFYYTPFYRNSPFSDASSNNSYTSSMFWTDTESTPSEYDSDNPMFDDPSYHAPLSPRSPTSRSPLYLPSFPDIPRLEDDYEAHDTDENEPPIDYPTDDEAEEELAEQKLYESWIEI